MSLVGHGVLGLRDNLRTFFDLVEESSADRRSLLEMSPGVEISPTAWELHSGAAWKTIVHYVFDGVIRDVVSVDTGKVPSDLTRVESIADCVATGATYFFDIDAAVQFGPPAWDDGTTLWDQAGAVWDGSPEETYPPGTLYVHLPEDVPPANTTVVAGLGWYFGERGEMHPNLGPDKLTDGDFETASLPNWTEVLSGTGTSSARDTTVKRVGVASVRLTHSGSSVDAVASRTQSPVAVAGKSYRLSGYYLTDAANPVGLDANLLVVDSTGAGASIFSDGRNWGNVAPFSDLNLRPTAGEWRRFCFDLVANTTTLSIRLRLVNNTGGAATGNAYFDGVRLQRIYRFNLYEPRLGESSLPETESAKAAVHFGGKAIGLGQVSLLNGDGALDAPFGQLLLLNRPVKVFDGGSFLDSQELLRDDYRTGFFGHTRDVEAQDSTIRFDLEDAWTVFQELLPVRTYGRSQFANMRGETDGQARPLLFGTGIDASLPHQGTHTDRFGPIQPARIDVTANGYGIYEVADPTNAPGQLDSIAPFGAGDSVIWDGEWIFSAASQADADELVDLFLARVRTSGASQSVNIDTAVGRIEVTSNIAWHPKRTGARGRETWPLPDLSDIVMGLVIGGGSQLDHLSPGPSAKRATVIFNGFHSGSPDFTTMTYDETTHLFNITKTSGTLTLQTNTTETLYGRKNGWGDFGYTTEADHSGALSYTAETPTFNSVDAEHFLVVYARGYRDTASGEYTGTAAAVIKLAPDIVRVLLERHLRLPSSRINKASFVAGRSTTHGAFPLAAYIHERAPAAEILERFENGALADIVIDGEGVVHWVPYSDATVRRSFFDRDYMTWSIRRRTENIISGVRVFSRLVPHDKRNGPKRTTERRDDSIVVTHGREEIKDFWTYLDHQGANVGVVADDLLRLGVADPRVATFSAKGGLVDLKVSDVIELTRSRALDPTGALDAVKFKISRLRRNRATGVSYCEAVEYIPLS